MSAKAGQDRYNVNLRLILCWNIKIKLHFSIDSSTNFKLLSHAFDLRGYIRTHQPTMNITVSTLLATTFVETESMEGYETPIPSNAKLYESMNTHESASISDDHLYTRLSQSTETAAQCAQQKSFLESQYQSLTGDSERHVYTTPGRKK